MGVMSLERREHIVQQLALLSNAKRGGSSRIMVCCPVPWRIESQRWDLDRWTRHRKVQMLRMRHKRTVG